MKVLKAMGKGIEITFRFIGAGILIILNGIMNFIGYLIALIAR